MDQIQLSGLNNRARVSGLVAPAVGMLGKEFDQLVQSQMLLSSKLFRTYQQLITQECNGPPITIIGGAMEQRKEILPLLKFNQVTARQGEVVILLRDDFSVSEMQSILEDLTISQPYYCCDLYGATEPTFATVSHMLCNGTQLSTVKTWPLELRNRLCARVILMNNNVGEVITMLRMCLELQVTSVSLTWWSPVRDGGDVMEVRLATPKQVYQLLHQVAEMPEVINGEITVGTFNIPVCRIPQELLALPKFSIGLRDGGTQFFPGYILPPAVIVTQANMISSTMSKYNHCLPCTNIQCPGLLRSLLHYYDESEVLIDDYT